VANAEGKGGLLSEPTLLASVAKSIPLWEEEAVQFCSRI
jgi:hypothetical protein